MFDVFLLLGRVCLREIFFFQMKEMPTGTIIAVQKLSGNKYKVSHWKYIKNNPSPRWLCCTYGGIWPGMCFVGIFFQLTESL